MMYTVEISQIDNVIPISDNSNYVQIIRILKEHFGSRTSPIDSMLLGGSNLVGKFVSPDFTCNPAYNLYYHKRFGWDILHIHIIIGGFDLVYDHTLDTIGLSNSGALIDLHRMVHYKGYYEKESSEDIIRKDALYIDGDCNLWITGDKL